jgi:hypothetical protein
MGLERPPSNLDRFRLPARHLGLRRLDRDRGRDSMQRQRLDRSRVGHAACSSDESALAEANATTGSPGGAGVSRVKRAEDTADLLAVTHRLD